MAKRLQLTTGIPYSPNQSFRKHYEEWLKKEYSQKRRPRKNLVRTLTDFLATSQTSIMTRYGRLERKEVKKLITLSIEFGTDIIYKVLSIKQQYEDNFGYCIRYYADIDEAIEEELRLIFLKKKPSTPENASEISISH